MKRIVLLLAISFIIPALLSAADTPVAPNGIAYYPEYMTWKAEKHPSFPEATVPGAFVQVEFMIKDSTKYKDTGGWGFARFVGNELTPYGKDAGFVSECFHCHMPVANNDYLFTNIVKTP